MFVIAAFAEAARLPFDLPEAEQELIGGYHTEYAGMKLLLFLIAEFLHMVTAAFLIVILFLGGWHFWGITGRRRSRSAGRWRSLRVVVLTVEDARCVIVFFMMVRWSWPRFRFDQLMNLAWKVMLPLGLVNLVAVAIAYRIRACERADRHLGRWLWIMIARGRWAWRLVSWVLAAVVLAAAHATIAPGWKIRPSA